MRTSAIPNSAQPSNGIVRPDPCGETVPLKVILQQELTLPHSLTPITLV